ncbi:vicilin-like antimicrobial peptides 2-2, partial [Trifolium medium]|nr:vicilin-like antimicrobial peptides 2-2 [Trifolium medium]
MMQDQEDEDDIEEVEKKTSWSWRKLLESVFGDEIENKKRDNVAHKSPRSCNLYDRKPDFKNSYGWSVALDGSEYSPLKSSGIGIYHVNLKPCSHLSLTAQNPDPTIYILIDQSRSNSSNFKGSMMTPHVNPRATEYGIVVKGS